MEDSYGYNESLHDGINSFPQHHPRFPHRQSHGDRLPWIQTDPEYDHFEGGGPLWEILSDGTTNIGVIQKPGNTLKGIHNPIPRKPDTP